MIYSIHYTYHDVYCEDVDVMVTCRSFKDLQRCLKEISDVFALTEFSVVKLPDDFIHREKKAEERVY